MPLAEIFVLCGFFMIYLVEEVTHVVIRRCQPKQEHVNGHEHGCEDMLQHAVEHEHTFEVFVSYAKVKKSIMRGNPSRRLSAASW